jgi:hypothetical protein
MGDKDIRIRWETVGAVVRQPEPGNRVFTTATLEQWVAWIFDHPVGEPLWYDDEKADWWDGPASVTLEYATRLFEDPAGYLETYSDAQLGQGFWFLASPEASAQLTTILIQQLPWAQRQRCLRAMVSLFEKLFAVRCSPRLSHLMEQGANPLNAACYMWWDHLRDFAQASKKSHSEVQAEMIKVMTDILNIESDACRESALHGLGHWRSFSPDAVKSIIRKFIAVHPGVHPQLKAYAEEAAEGKVL